MELKRCVRNHTRWIDSLLIVPYGIETILEIGLHGAFHAFNRTLWN